MHRGDQVWVRQTLGGWYPAEVVAAPDQARHEVLVRSRTTGQYDKVALDRVTMDREQWEAAHRSASPSQPVQVLTPGRVTRCWECHEPLTTWTHAECPSCGWIVCRSGHCSPTCATPQPRGAFMGLFD